MSTPLPKRRRLHDPQTVLKKPFKSPFKTPVKNTAEASRATLTHSTDASTPAPTPSTSTPLRQTTTQPTNLTATSSHPQPSPLATRHRPCAKPSPSSHTPHLTTLLAREISHQRALHRSISALRSTNDTLSQALALATSTRDVELEALVIKWRDAARAAAEEVFAGSRDRVNGMGGVGAWREREQRQREFRDGGFEDEGAGGGEGESESEEDEDEEEGLGAEELEGRKMARERRREVRKEAKREREWRREEWEQERKAVEAEKPKVVEEGRDDDSFTMDMMLKTLNIELDVIGWSKTQQRWVG